MQRFYNVCLAAAFSVLVLFASCKQNEQAAQTNNTVESAAAVSGSAEAPANAGGAETLDKDASYAFGMALATGFKDTGLSFDYDELVTGFADSLEGRQTRFSEDEAAFKVQMVYTTFLNNKVESLRVRENEFLAANAKKEGVITTPSGLQYEIVRQGNGAKPTAANKVRVKYEGTLIDGTVFDSSYERNAPAEFSLSQVIPGWTEGIQLMNVGSEYWFYIPSALAYGENGSSSIIPPYSTLIFKVELLDIL